MSTRSSGTSCAVRGCSNNQRKLNVWLQGQCLDHAPQTKLECVCERRYRFHRLPKDEEPRGAWLKNLNLEKPPQTLYVCSFHFVDKKPTEENPTPTLWLGYDKPWNKRLRRFRTTGEVDLKKAAQSSCDAQTQRSDSQMENHVYNKEPNITSGVQAPPPAEPHPVTDQSLVRMFKEEPENSGVQSPEDATSGLNIKEEPEEVGIKAESDEDCPYVRVVVKSEDEDENSDGAGAASDKPPESEEHGENSSDTDDSEDWTPSAERPQTHSGVDEQLQGPAAEAPAKRHVCSHCGKAFRTRAVLRTHERTHSGEKPFRCTVCEKCFPGKLNLTLHMRIHTGEKPFKCSVCSKDFNQVSNLYKHMRSHTGERPFRCSVCSKDFSDPSHLKIHMRAHTGEKPFECSICGRTFTANHNLKMHMRTHTREKPFRCPVCEKDFTQMSSLNRHARSHTGERPFTCSFCEKGFTQMSHLKIHVRYHTGEKPFVCSVCEKGFAEKGTLTAHLRTHTREKPSRETSSGNLSTSVTDPAAAADLNNVLGTFKSEKALNRIPAGIIAAPESPE